MAKWLVQLRLLLWKNFLIQSRRKVSTVFEIFLPIFFVFILLLLRITTIKVENAGQDIWPPFSLNRTVPLNKTSLDHDDESVYYQKKVYMGIAKPQWTLAYAPNTTFIRGIMQHVSDFLDIGVVQGFADGDTLSKAVVTDEELPISEQTFLCAVEFTSGDDEKNIKYTLRFPANSRVQFGDKKLQKFISFVPTKWYTQLVYPFTFGGMGPRNENITVGGPPPYFREGFLSAQYGVEMAIIKSKMKSSGSTAAFPNVTVQMRRFPYRDTIRDGFIVVIQNSLPLLLMLSLVYSALVIVKSIVHEKEMKLKESMKMMGLRNWLHWMAWFIKCSFFLLIPVSICTIMLCVRFVSAKPKMLNHSDGSLIFVFLLLYTVSGIMFCFFVSTLFYRANIAAAGGGILWFLSYTPYFFLFNYYQQMSDSSRLLACFDFQVAMAFGGYLIGQFEGQGRGVQWSTLTQGVTVDQNFSFGQVLLMQIVDCFLYGILAWYVENVFPGEFGIPKRFYFPFSRKYWCDIQETEENVPLLDNDTLQENFDPDEDDENVFERYPQHLKTGVRIHKLRKVFQTEAGTKVAVDNLSLNLLEGQITALLGHNGAGKTTTISMLTGLFPPTSGTAVVNGYDILHNMGGIRESLGICPQHNVLFDTLTVEEHLKFFTMLKGVTGSKQIKDEVDYMVESIGLLDKREVESRNLSGGMKRKLSVGCALVGNSKVVILDEPTSGMDVSARRFTWELLQRERSGRTILLTTHFMDEADVLGDRIAIMADGKVKCCGSSLYLKKKYGVGYHMVMVKDKQCNPVDVNNVIVKYVPTAQLESNIGFELSFILSSEFSHKFEPLFTELEERRKELGILSYGASVTTLEEVFIKVGEKQGEETGLSSSKALFRQLSGTDAARPLEESSQRLSMDEMNQSQNLPMIKNSGRKLFFQRWYAMFVKKMLHSKRHKSSIVSQLVMPSIFVLLSLIVVKTLPNATKSPARSLDLAMFGKRQRVPYCALDGTNAKKCSANSRIFSTNFDTVLQSETNADREQVGGIPMVDYLIQKEKYNDLGQFNLLYPIGFEAGQNGKSGYRVTAWFNNEALHTSAIALNFISNILLRNLTGDSSTMIEATNYPLPPTTSQSTKDTKMNPAGFQIGFSLCFGMAFLASSFIMFLVQERSSKAKHLQFVSGVDPISYWTSTYLWDLINFLLPCAVIIILFVIFSIDAYTHERIGYVTLLLLLYGWAIIPMMYIFSYFFDVASTAFTRMTILNVITGLATLLIVYILSIPSLDLLDVAKALKWAFLVLPNYNLGQGMVDLFNNYQFQHAFENENPTEMCVQFSKSVPKNPFPDALIRAVCNESLQTYDRGHIDVDACIRDDQKAFGKQFPFGMLCNTIEQFLVNATSNFQWNYLAWDNPGIGRFLIFLALEGFVFFGIVLMIEYRVFKRAYDVLARCVASLCTRRNAVYVMTSDHLLDSDVVNEKIRVDNQHRGNDVLMLRDLTKIFRQRTGQPLVAVDHLSLGIPHGECFGLLGQNGAGKTTTFRILTGDETMSSGSAYIDSYDVTRDFNEVRQRMGYCPQFDALIDLMTGRELLWMFCRLRGVPEQHIGGVVKKLAKDLSVYEHIDKVSKTYSGGNKRKLSTAIALCGDPSLIFLDEPSSGMDPVARRMLWNSLSRVIVAGKSIVITSHSMEECEALCTRVAIMVNGQFKCLGSPQHLKNKFGEGYTLIARVGDTNQDTTLLKAFVEREFPGSLLKDEHQGYVHYQLNAENKTWANLFGTMEGAKQEYNIEDYSISQTTLEQVFLNFTRAQRETED